MASIVKFSYTNSTDWVVPRDVIKAMGLNYDPNHSLIGLKS